MRVNAQSEKSPLAALGNLPHRSGTGTKARCAPPPEASLLKHAAARFNRFP